MPRFITLADFDGMFSGLAHSAWRLESRRRYASDEATNTYRQFAAGLPVAWDLTDPWCTERREQVALGRRFERVRILDDPATEGQRYLLDNARRNRAAGEDVRTLTRAQADKLRLPDEDFWIFDARVVTRLHFDADDDLTRVELITDPGTVLRYCQAREAAWQYARTT
ncbi:DUF6879 family protein [Streptomyces sp. NPDC001594]|uniref:DUF6879 family protein n=1 Tax=Streptomyces sp. NPDC001594 TaxID=3364590 RepID=UPI00367CCD8B